MDRITDMVISFNASGTQEETSSVRQELLDYCAQVFYQYPKEVHLMDEEFCAQFLIENQPYFMGIIRNFKERGLSFETYLKKIVRIRTRMFMSNIRKAHRMERMVISSTSMDGLVFSGMNMASERDGSVTLEAIAPEEDPLEVMAENAPDYAPTKLPAHVLFDSIVHNHAKPVRTSQLSQRGPQATNTIGNMFKDLTFRKRFLLLVLSFPDQLNDSMVSKIAEALEVPTEDLAELVHEISQYGERRTRRRELLRQIVNKHWKRYVWLDHQIQAVAQEGSEDTYVLRKLRRERDWARTSLRARRREIRHCPPGISNEELSQVLGIPKGTICSSTFYARKALASCMQEQS